MKAPFATLSTLSLGTSLATAALSFTGSPVNQTFTGFDGNSAPLGWDAFGFSSGSGFSENRGLSTGGVSTGGTYAFDLGGSNIALGVQPIASDFTPGYYELEITNNSASTLNGIILSFDGYFLNDQDRSNSLSLSTSTDGSSFTPVSGATFTSPSDQDSSGWTLGLSQSSTVAAIVPVGGSFFLRFTGDDVGGAGSRDEFAIDNVTFSAIPEPSTPLLCGLTLCAFTRRRR